MGFFSDGYVRVKTIVSISVLIVIKYSASKEKEAAIRPFVQNVKPR
jgi:hypothetical protein